jgi:hypothetical protein
MPLGFKLNPEKRTEIRNQSAAATVNPFHQDADEMRRISRCRRGMHLQAEKGFV